MSLCQVKINKLKFKWKMKIFFLPWSVTIDSEGPVHPVDIDRLNFPISLFHVIMWTFDVVATTQINHFSNINILWTAKYLQSFEATFTPPPLYLQSHYNFISRYILSLLINYVENFVLTFVPPVVNLYTIYQHFFPFYPKIANLNRSKYRKPADI